MTILQHLSPRAIDAPESGIVEVVNYARGRDGLIPLWVGEGDSPTPEFINRAAISSLDAGETFYTWQRGIPALREALAGYYQRHFGVSLPMEHFYVVGSGMQAIQLGIQAIASPGDELLFFSPAWPNFAAAASIADAVPVPVELTYEAGKWKLDLDRLKAALTPKTRMLFVNTPSNPTGWTASREDLAALLGFAREHGLWIMADEIYALYYYGREARAPSFMDVMQPGDRILFVNSFSKNWSMTGWRVGWIVAPPEMGQVIENLVQYSTSGVAQFIQQGAVAALNDGDDFLKSNIDKARRSRDVLCEALSATNRVETLKPDGALYTFLRIDGLNDSRAAAIDIVDKTGVGLAPGTAFGPGGAPFMRACFLRQPAIIEEAASRLERYIRAL
jgi:aspartate/methionine/tyrosine aminotransferase